MKATKKIKINPDFKLINIQKKGFPVFEEYHLTFFNNIDLERHSDILSLLKDVKAEKLINEFSFLFLNFQDEIFKHNFRKEAMDSFENSQQFKEDFYELHKILNQVLKGKNKISEINIITIKGEPLKISHKDMINKIISPFKEFSLSLGDKLVSPYKKIGKRPVPDFYIIYAQILLSLFSTLKVSDNKKFILIGELFSLAGSELFSKTLNSNEKLTYGNDYKKVWSTKIKMWLQRRKQKGDNT